MPNPPAYFYPVGKVFRWISDEISIAGLRFLLPWLVLMFLLWLGRYYIFPDSFSILLADWRMRICAFLAVFFLPLLLYVITRQANPGSIKKLTPLILAGVYFAAILGINETIDFKEILQLLFQFLGMAGKDASYYSSLLEYQLHAVVFYGLAILIPVGFYWIAKKRLSQQSRYDESDGLKSRLLQATGLEERPGIRNYIPLMAALSPVIVFAAITPAFTSAYPLAYTKGGSDFFAHFPQNLIFFESLYILQFVFLEMFFRGFMLRTLSNKCQECLASGTGGNIGEKENKALSYNAAIWVMSSMYFFIHFMKPAAEALSSLFGGAALGIISYRSKSIIGGMIIHIYIALLMEATAALARF